MGRTGKLAAAAAVVTALVALAVPAAAQSGSTKPKATEVGVTASEIHIAVVADVDSPLAPNLFKGSVDGVKAAARYLNSQAGGGGIAGRKLVVDFYDSKLNPAQARNATIAACQNDLAMVGTAAIFLTSVDDIVSCKDQAGATVGLPDLSSFAAGTAEACASTSYPVNGVNYDCATLTQSEQTYLGNQGAFKWQLSKHQHDLHGPMIVGSDVKNPNFIAATAQKAGITPDQGSVVPKSARDPQSAYTSVIQQMKADNSNYSLMTSSANALLEMRDEATLQSLDSAKVVWDTVSSYGNAIVAQNAASFEGQYQSLGFLPFEEAKSNPTLAAFLKDMKQVGGTPDQFAVYAWDATLAFAEAAKAVVAKQGVNGITRSSFIHGLESLTAFDAGGMTGTHSFATQKPSPCFVVMRFVNGKWARQYPSKAGTFDCKASNVITFKADLIN
jgi:hypothetical protein